MDRYEPLAPHALQRFQSKGKRTVVTSFIHTSIVIDRSWQDEMNDRNHDQAHRRRSNHQLTSENRSYCEEGKVL